MKGHYNEEEMLASEEKIRLPRDWDHVLKILDEVVGHKPPEDQDK